MSLTRLQKLRVFFFILLVSMSHGPGAIFMIPMMAAMAA